MKEIYQLRTKHKIKLLFAMMRALAGNDAKISFEGRLAGSKELVSVGGVHFEETEVLRRQTLQPTLDFVVLPLNQTLLPTIEKAIESKIAFSHSSGIIHVQIESHGQIAFAAYDEFDHGCVVAYPPVSTDLLNQLVGKRVLHSYNIGQLAIPVGIPLA